MTPSKNIFITGGNGFVGSHLVKYLRSHGHFVKCFEGDITDLDSIKIQLGNTKSNWDTIIHLAGVSSPVICEKDPKTAFSTNVLGTSMLLEGIRHTNFASTAHIIFPSTAHIYSIAKDGTPITEDTPIQIRNVYGETKIQGENLVKGFSERYKVKSTILRLFNHAHISQSTDFFIPSLFHQIKNLKSNEHQVLVGDLDLYRDFGTIPDLLSAFLTIVNRAASKTDSDVLNICSGKSFYLADLAKEFAISLNRNDVQFITDKNRLRAGEIKTVVGSFAKIQREYGWTPTHTEINYFFRDLNS